MKNEKTTEQQESPTTFQLAQLAIMIQGQLPSPGKPNLTEQVMAWKAAERNNGKAYEPGQLFRDAVDLASDLWAAAAQAKFAHVTIEQQLSQLREGLLTLPASEWAENLKSFKGHPRAVDRFLDNELVSVECSEKELFKDRSLSSATRRKLLLGLVKFAADHRLKFSDGRTLCRAHEVEAFKSKYQGETALRVMTARECRHFVEARHRQLAENKKRDVNPARYKQRPVNA
jgi:hypothetical protein